MQNIKSLRNLRDMGSCKWGSKQIKAGMLIRSDCPRNLSEEEESILYDMHVREIVDFRSDEEVAIDPYQLSNRFCYHHISALKTKSGIENFYFFRLVNNHSTKQEIMDAAAFIKEGYTVLPFANQAYQKVFDLMMEKDGGILFHCSGGKDRTGVMAALILKLFGADDETIMHNYLLSNQYALPGLIEHIDELHFTGVVKETMIYVCSVHEELLQSAFTAILQRYESFDMYFEKEYGLNETKREFLRKKYVEEVKDESSNI